MRADDAADAGDETGDQRGDVVAGCLQRLTQRGEDGQDFLLDHLVLQLRLVAEVVMQKRRRHRGFAGDVPQRRGMDALAAEAGQRRVKQAAAQVGRVGHGPAWRALAGRTRLAASGGGTEVFVGRCRGHVRIFNSSFN